MKTETIEVCNQEMKKKEEKNKGFSLVELIVVIAIMAILAIVIAPQVMKYIGQSRSSVDATNIALYKTAVNTALADENAYKEVVASTADIVIVVTAPATAGDPPTVTYTGVANSGAFAVELKEVLGETYPIPKQSGYNRFEINIDVDTTEKTAGAVTVKALKTPVPVTP